MSKILTTVSEQVWSRIIANSADAALLIKTEVVAGGPETFSVTWHEYGLIVAEASLFLCRNGIKKGDRVAIFGDCSPEWAVINRAIQSRGVITVGLYGDSTRQQLAYIIKDSGAKMLLVESSRHSTELQAHIGRDVQVATFSQVLEHVPEPRLGADRLIGRQLSDFRTEARRELWELGFLYQASQRGDPLFRNQIAHLDDISALIYTSGSTGVPKGVVLTHRNVAASCRSLTRRGFDFKKTDIFLHYLDFAHVYSRVNGLEMAECSGTISCFCKKDHLKKALTVFRPTVLLGVPRVWNRVKTGIEIQVQNKTGKKGKLARWALTCEQKGFKHFLADRLVFAKIRRQMGAQRLRTLLSGSAAIPIATVDFFNLIGLQLREGYGLTETCGGICANTGDDNKFGSLGKPIDGVVIKIIPDPDFPAPGTGLLWVRGDCVFRGYWNMPEKKKEVFDENGWFNTGDIVYRDEDGFLWYRGRKLRHKKLDTGKFFSEEKIQAAMDGSSIVSAVVPTGEARAYVGALIFVDPDTARELAGLEKMPGGSDELLFLARHAAVRAAVAETIARANSTLEPWERVKHWEIIPIIPTVENGLLTNTQKIRIEEAQRRFSAQIEEIHSRPREKKSENCIPAVHQI